MLTTHSRIDRIDEAIDAAASIEDLRALMKMMLAEYRTRKKGWRLLLDSGVVGVDIHNVHDYTAKLIAFNSVRYYGVIAEQNASDMGQLFIDCQNQPGPRTISALKNAGFHIGVPLPVGGSSGHIYKARRYDGAAAIMKRIATHELEGYMLVAKLLDSNPDSGGFRRIGYRCLSSLAAFQLIELDTHIQPHASRDTSHVNVDDTPAAASAASAPIRLSNSPPGFAMHSDINPISRFRWWAAQPSFEGTLRHCAVYRPLEANFVVQLIDRITRALTMMHNFGIAHMDIKPDNVFMLRSGEYYLGDFGSVRTIGTSTAHSTSAFVPRDVRYALADAQQLMSHHDSPTYRASRLHDYWMLAATVYWSLGGKSVRDDRAADADPTRHQLLHAIAMFALQQIAAGNIAGQSTVDTLLLEITTPLGLPL